MSIGEIIQRKRNERGLSQEKLAELVGVSRQAVSKWELRDAIPDTDKLVPLCRALGITVDELLGNVPEPKPAPEAYAQQPIMPEKKPGWFAAHWYWLGLIPVAWGVIQLLKLLPVLLMLLLNLSAFGGDTTIHVPAESGTANPFVGGAQVEIFQDAVEIPGVE